MLMCQLCVLCSLVSLSSMSVCVSAWLCVGSGSMCVRVRGEVSLGWPWLESLRRAEVKEEICRKDTHHFPHYYFFFFLLVFYVSVSHRFCPPSSYPPTLQPLHTPLLFPFQTIIAQGFVDNVIETCLAELSVK